MSRKINVKWDELVKLRERTSINASDFENARKKIQEITMSLNDCWRGQDADNFRLTMCSYLDSLKEDTEYLLRWVQFFEKSARKYNSGVAEGVSKVRSFMDEKFSNNMNGVNGNV